MWACASQTRNELKKKAKHVVEQIFKLGELTVLQRTEAALWLVATHPTRVIDGTGNRYIPNFVFGGLELHFGKQGLDRQVCTSIMLA